MAIGIAGVRLRDISIGVRDNGETIVSGTYELVSTADKVLATQTFNQYGSMTVAWSPDTIRAADALRAACKKDIETMIGIGGVE